MIEKIVGTVVYIIGIPIYFTVGMHYWPGEIGYWALTCIVWPFGLLLTTSVFIFAGIFKFGIFLAGLLF